MRSRIRLRSIHQRLRKCQLSRFTQTMVGWNHPVENLSIVLGRSWSTRSRRNGKRLPRMASRLRTYALGSLGGTSNFGTGARPSMIDRISSFPSSSICLDSTHTYPPHTCSCHSLIQFTSRREPFPPFPIKRSGKVGDLVEVEFSF
jgi:hypothetical protein